MSPTGGISDIWLTKNDNNLAKIAIYKDLRPLMEGPISILRDLDRFPQSDKFQIRCL